MDKSRRISTLAASMLVCNAMVCVAEPRFGELPPGAISISETDGVAAEICRDHLFDPAAAAVRLPVGFRLISAADAAARDPALQPLLQANPKLRSYAPRTLCFVSAERFVVDGNLVQAVNPMPLAFWWASAEGPRDPNMRGKASWIQLGSWYPSGTPGRSSVVHADPMAEFASIEVEQIEPNRWRMRLVLPGETVTAEVTSSGRRTPSRAEQPGFMSVAMSGKGAGYFSVFTYFGHHHQAAHGAWRANGGGVFTDAFAVTGESGVFGTAFQNGWSSRAGLYRFSAK